MMNAIGFFDEEDFYFQSDPVQPLWNGHTITSMIRDDTESCLKVENLHQNIVACGKERVGISTDFFKSSWKFRKKDFSAVLIGVAAAAIVFVVAIALLIPGPLTSGAPIIGAVAIYELVKCRDVKDSRAPNPAIVPDL